MSRTVPHAGLSATSDRADRKPSDTATVVAEFTRLTNVLMEFAAKKSDDELRAPHGLPWAAPGPLWEFIGHDTFLREWPDHRAQIEVAAQVLGR